MTRLWPEGDAIRVDTDSRGAPRRFVWQGQAHAVQAIHQRWQVESDWWSQEGGVSRRYYALTTASGLLCVIYHDEMYGDETGQGWRLAKVYD